MKRLNSSIVYRLGIVGVTVVSAGFCAYILHLRWEGRTVAPLAIVQVASKRDALDANRVEIILELRNSSFRSVHILGVSRTDCGIRSVSEAPPFQIESNGLKQIALELSVGDNSDIVSVPLVIWASNDRSRNFDVIVGGNRVNSGAPTLAPDLESVVS